MNSEENNLVWKRYHLELKDGGQLYAETNLKHSIVEPWNAFSSLLFLVPAIYFLIKLKGRYKHNIFLTTSIPLLILGGIGSTLYHAFRAHYFFLWLDVVPIVILNVLVGTFFWLKILSRKWHLALVVVPLFFLRYFSFLLLPIHTAINLGYIITGTFLFLPMAILMFKTKFKSYSAMVTGLIFFLFALFFREIDARQILDLSMGTHFLWHVLCAVGSYFVGVYLYNVNNFEAIEEPIEWEEAA